MSKKLINEPDRVVDESLAGLVAVNSGLKLLEGHRVVVRADVHEVIKEGKVQIFYLLCDYPFIVTLRYCNTCIWCSVQ